jgi:uncharacterized membrane protein
MQAFAPAIYFLCFLTSAAAMLLLLRSYRQTRSRLVLWSGLAFVALAANNFFLFVDLVVLPTSIDLLPLRDASAFAAVALLIYSFIWEID